MHDTFHVHGPIRFGIGFLLISVACWLVLSAHDLGWGLSYSVIVPACALMFPGLALMKRKVLRLRENTVEVETGWLWRRARSLNLTDCSVEMLPMAGLWAVIVHRGEYEYPLLTWVGKKQAKSVLQFLDQTAPEEQWPRHQRERAQWDR